MRFVLHIYLQAIVCEYTLMHVHAFLQSFQKRIGVWTRTYVSEGFNLEIQNLKGEILSIQSIRVWIFGLVKKISFPSVKTASQV